MMQPKPSETIPTGNNWAYEVKYDGFRAALVWKEDNLSLVSRNGKDLSNNFPEIISACQEKQDLVHSLLPLKFDGEIVILNTLLQANFSLLQQRGRFKATRKIEQAAQDRPAHFLCFDLLEYEGKSLLSHPFQERKTQLKKVFDRLKIGFHISWNDRLGYIQTYSDHKKLWNNLYEQLGEGMIAKRLESKYIEGKNHHDWYKVKNWRTIPGVLTSYDQENGYFELSVYDGKNLVPLGKFKHGLEGNELETIKQFIHAKGNKTGNKYELPPAVCLDVNCLGIHEGDLREPQFHQFRFDLSPEDCTVSQVQEALSLFPDSISLTNQTKVFWEKAGKTKGDLLVYVRQIAPYMLPFTTNRALTVIRCPDGIHGQSFFQKHLPDYGPAFVGGIQVGDETLLHGGSAESLTWLANHGALEYHVPFQYMGKSNPIEIAFDLDPPSIDQFDVAIYAASLLKELLDQLQLQSFVKTSGNKGIQVYIPIPENSLTYAETAVFTQGIAFLLEKKHPDLFTTERLKKNRNNRLYIDYIQHGKDKTLIAPYSPRKSEAATVSTPLFWDEVNESLKPDQFTITSVLARVKEKGCPFASYEQVRDNQDLSFIKEFVHTKGV
ncbi:DNA ligase D [Aquibacillus albus]|uniref:DNA ligase (ATP) n=1 Tax=Aquibacillus albus TaxID=1168171 RepID=A0ABS2MXD0_9BACI|nr:DNA ligase D [Aquibacillus albus]MBM7570520.1 bifunctional non-homologous end joining protein LigD [Aquibacillus albus]